MRRDHLDDAIDHVASRMTQVEENDALASQIVNALPERSGWSMRWLMPRLAITAVLAAVAIAVVLRTFGGGSTDVLRTFDGRSTIVPRTNWIALAVTAPEHRTDDEPTLNVRRTLVEPLSNDPRTTPADAPDFDRSLAPVAAPDALVLPSLAPDALEASEGLMVKPLAIADLPLTADANSPR